MTEEYLDGKVAIITGAAGGFGAAVSREFARRGARLVLNDLPVTREKVDELVGVAKELGTEAIASLGDATATSDASRPATDALRTWGSLDILINLVGGSIGSAQRPIWEMEEAEWRRTLDQNLTSAFINIKAVLPHMMEKRSGRIVNTASTAWAGLDGSPAYSASKAGVVALTRTLSLQLAPYDINVNVVAPGLSRTGVMARLNLDPDAPLPDEWIRAIPLRRVNEPEDVAAAVSYLVSPMSRNVSGQVLTVAGGLNPSL